MKILKRAKLFLVFFLISILLVAGLRNVFCRLVLVGLTAKATGLRLSVKHLNLDILRSGLYLKDITLLNPPGFKPPVLAQAEEITFKYRPGSLLRGRLYFSEAKIKINEINIIRNEQGASNVASLKRRKAIAPKPTPTTKPQEPTPPAPEQKRIQTLQEKRPRLLIERLELSLAKVTYLDYQAGVGEPAAVIFTSKEPFVFHNVSDWGAVVSSVSAEGGFKYLLNNLLGAMPKDLIKNAGESIKNKIEGILPKVIKK
ncbi:MAG: hypothetical protein JW714_00190 [Candidatus Omnitrophica bacterium]|nr:hypothetical protein [Candidatus Omnitrophota bacterium]